MFRHCSLLFVVACASFAGGCDQNAPTTSMDNKDASTTAAVEPEKPVEPVERINPAIVLTATPNPADFCGDKKLTMVTVNWDVSATNVPTYSIWVEAPSIQRKAWVSGSKPSDSRETGPWVRNQTRFTMTDSTDTIIASTTVTAADCGGTTPAMQPADAAPHLTVPAPTSTPSAG